MIKFQLICLKCGSQDVGIRISLETAGTTYECGKCGNTETGDESDLMAAKCECGPLDGCSAGEQKNCPHCGTKINADEEPEPPIDYCHHG